MKVLSVDPENPQPAAISEAADVLRRGGLVAFPTETVYGLGANALDAEAIRSIYRAKQRPAVNPLIAHCSDTDAVRKIVADWPAAADRLAAAFWPGPLTLVLPKRDSIPDEATAGLPSVAVRVPSSPIAKALLEATGFPVVAPSANRYTELSPIRAEHVRRSLGDAVDLILDGGATTVGIESTVIDLTAGRPVLLRPGVIDRGRLEDVLGETLGQAGDFEDAAPKPSPGLSRRHYSPRATLRLLPRNAMAGPTDRDSGPVAALFLGDAGELASGEAFSMPNDPLGYAAMLYDRLHQLDEDGYRTVLVEEPPPDPAWDAIRDRLSRAASVHHPE